MLALAWILIVACGFTALVYTRASRFVWNTAIVAALMVATLTAAIPTWIATLGWILFGAGVAIFNCRPLRQRIVSQPILNALRKALPPMSTTEREAVNAGTTWWDADLFSGQPDWRSLLSTPIPTLTDEEQAFLEGPVEELCRRVDDWEINHELKDLPADIWDFLKKNGFFGMIIPKRYGGLGFSARAHSEVVMKICTHSAATGVTVMVPNSLGPAELLLHYGTQAQKDHYLPRLASGKEIPCFALTSPEAGSDAGSIPDLGVVCYGKFRGKKNVLGIRLNWEKRYITLGPVATLLGLAFKLTDPDHLLGEIEELGITLALIPTDTRGITIGRRHRPMDLAFQNGPNSGNDVFIPLDWIIGGPDMAGKGWMMLMECLAAGRSISLPALSTGSAKLASRATGSYAGVRKQFNTAIGYFEGVEEALTRIAGNTYLMDAARTLTAGAVDLGEKPSVISAIVKYHLTERYRQVINDAMDIHGGKGICMGPRNYLARGYQGVPIAITVEGANILSRSMIIFGQGAIRCHPYLLDEMEAATDDDAIRALETFDEALFSHLGFTARNAVSSLLLGVTGARLASSPVFHETGWYYRQLTRMSAALAVTSDIAIFLLGASLKRREKLSARLGDVLSHLYLASACLKRFEDQGRPEGDLPLVQWACQDCLARIQSAFDEFFRNFPNRLLATALRFLVFPLGKPYQCPDDELGQDVARVLLEPSDTRDRLTAGMFLGSSGDQVRQLDDALSKVVTTASLHRRIGQALKEGRIKGQTFNVLLDNAVLTQVISEKEAEALRDAEAARRDVIQVDDFAPDTFGKRSRGPALRVARMA